MGFDNLKQAGKSFNKTPGPNVALVVESYNVEGTDPLKHTVTGKAVHNGETMTISLRPDPGADKRSYKRAEVANWAARRDKAATDPGGVIVFEAVYPVQGAAGQFSSKWGNAVSHTPEEASVLIAHASPVVTRNEKFAMDILRVPAARAVSSKDELREAMIEAMSAGIFCSALVRASDGNEVRSWRVERYEKNAQGKFESINAEKAADNFMASDAGKALSENIGTDFVTEVIPGERIFAGKDTQAKIEKSGGRTHHERFHKMGDAVGFTQTIIAVRKHPEGGTFFTFFIPASTVPQIYTKEGIPSAAIQPKVSPFVANSGTQDDAAELGSAGELPGGDPAESVARAAAALGGRP